MLAIRAAARSTLAGMLAVTACGEATRPPDVAISPTFERGGVGRPSVLVNPSANENGTARTIQEGLDMVAAGGTVRVSPGTYAEALTITKGVTVEGIGGASDQVIIEPPAGPNPVVAITAAAPVVLRNLIVHVRGANGIRGVGVVDVTVEGSTVQAVNPPLGASWMIIVVNNTTTGNRARLAVRRTTVDALVGRQNPPPPPFPQSFGVAVEGDVDASIEENSIRRTGGACIFIVTRSDLAGETNADIMNNDIDECHPLGRVASILVGPLAANLPSATRPLRSTGVVNIVGNTIRNTAEACVTSSAIVYEVFTGRIEHNRILSVVKACAFDAPRVRPSAIWIGARLNAPFPPVAPTVRFNDIVGNAHAGLRIAPNQTVAIDARCNYWGAANGPSGVGSGSGDAIVVEAGGATPTFVPFATRPIAGTGATSC